MPLILIADDFARTGGMTDAILACVDAGRIDAVSILANGDAFDHAVAALKNRPGLGCQIHLNLVEGMPISPPSEVDLLVDDRGRFRHSFVSLWRAYLFASPAVRRRMGGQVRREFDAQIRRVADHCALGDAIAVDGHEHVHMLPFVFDAIIDLAATLPITYVRLPREPWFLSWRGGGWRCYFGANIVKHVLLRLLSARANRQRRHVGANDHFIGVLFSGRMSAQATADALGRLGPRETDGSIIEVLFHPGGATPEEAAKWPTADRHGAFYCSPRRQQEAAELMSHSMKRLMASYRA